MSSVVQSQQLAKDITCKYETADWMQATVKAKYSYLQGDSYSNEHMTFSISHFLALTQRFR